MWEWVWRLGGDHVKFVKSRTWLMGCCEWHVTYCGCPIVIQWIDSGGRYIAMGNLEGPKKSDRRTDIML